MKELQQHFILCEKAAALWVLASEVEQLISNYQETVVTNRQEPDSAHSETNFLGLAGRMDEFTT